jgi:hypothetical protein
MQSLRRFMLVLATSLLLAGFLVGAVGSAEAATHPQSVTLTASNGVRTISCTVKANNPHKSTHQPANVNSEVTISCTAQVVKMTGVVSLYKSGSFYRNGDAATYNNTSGAAWFANGPCVNAAYQVKGQMSVTFPAGYTQNLQQASVDSAVVNVTC